MKSKYTILSLCFVAVYLGSYLALSLSGAYMPATYGTNGIKDWAWTPRGFADDSGRLRIGLVIPFFPLYWIDSRYWHSDWTGLSGPQKMPVQPNKIGRANRRPAFPLNTARQFDRKSCAPPFLSVAVAHLYRSAASS